MGPAVMTASGEYAIFKAGKPLGRESFEIVPETAGTVARGKVSLDLPGGFDQESELRLDAAGRPRLFKLDRQSGEDSARLEVTFEGSTASLASVTGEGERREEMEVSPDLLVLGSNVFHHFLFFWLRYDRARGGPQTFPVFPRRSVVMERKGDRRAELGGREETVAHLFVDLDGVLGIDLFCWGGRLLKVAVPLQRLEAVLEGVPGLTRETGFPPVAGPPPEAPSPFPEEEVRFASAEGIMLAGTLTRPLSPPPWPGVVLVSGSGPQDRNGDTVGPGGVHFGFLRTLARRLAAESLAVLRYDERGVASSGGVFRTAGLSDLTEDARAAVAFLAGRAEILPHRLGIVGHSEGGLIAALVAAQAPEVAAVALLATLARPLDEVLLRQFETLLARSVPAERRAAAVARRRETLETLKRTGNWAAPEVEEEVRRAIVPERRRWFAEHFALDPLDAVRRVRCAVGIFQGGRDVQVDPEDVALFSRALDEAGHEDHEVLIFPRLDHFFMPSTGRGLSEYADESRRVDEELLSSLATWLAARLAPSAGPVFARDGSRFEDPGAAITPLRLREERDPMPDDISTPAVGTSRQELIDALNEDLSREYQAIIAYVVYSQVLKGAEHMSIAKELETHAAEELSHALIISNQIDYLGGTPTVTPKPVKLSEDPRELLRFDLENESETIRQYRRRVRQCEALDEIAIAEHIREILKDEQEHLIDLATALGEDPPVLS